MARRQYTLILDPERSDQEDALAELLDGLGRTERQNALRSMLLFSLRLKQDDLSLYTVAEALFQLPSEEMDSFDKFVDVVTKYRPKKLIRKPVTPNIVESESRTAVQPEPKASEEAEQEVQRRGVDVRYVE